MSQDHGFPCSCPGELCPKWCVPFQPILTSRNSNSSPKWPLLCHTLESPLCQAAEPWVSFTHSSAHRSSADAHYPTDGSYTRPAGFRALKLPPRTCQPPQLAEAPLSPPPATFCPTSPQRTSPLPISGESKGLVPACPQFSCLAWGLQLPLLPGLHWACPPGLASSCRAFPDP